MANDYRLQLQLDWIETTFQRSATGATDDDVATLYVTTTHDNDSKRSSGPVPIGKFITGSSGPLNPPVQTPEILVSSDTDLLLFCTINNAASTGVEKAVAQGLQIASDVVLALSAGEALLSQVVKGSLSKFLLEDAGLGGIISGALQFASNNIEPVLESLGFTDPDCDGPVFQSADAMKFTVGDIAKAWSDSNLHRLALGIPFPIGVWTDDSQQSQKGCGHPPVTSIRVSAVFNWRRYPIIVPDSRIAAVSTRPGETSLFALTDDHQIWTKFFDPDHPGLPERGGWSDWLPLGPKTFQGVFPDHPQVVAISTVPGGVTLFILGDDGLVWSKFFDPNHLGPPEFGGWSDWFPLGTNTFPTGAPIVAVSSTPGGVQIFIHGNDGQIWSKYFDPQHPGPAQNNGWSDWFAMGPKTFGRYKVDAVSSSPRGTQIFIVGDDNQIWSKFFDPDHPGPAINNGWSDWFPMGPKTFPSGAVTVASSATRATQLFAVDDDGQVWSKSFDPDHLGPPELGGWTDWFPLGPKKFFFGRAQIAAISSTPKGVQLFMMGDDSQVWSKYFDPAHLGPPELGGWSDWFPLGPNVFPNSTFTQSLPLSAMSGKPRGVQLFGIGKDDQVWSEFFDPDHLGPPELGGWSGWFSLGP